MNTVGLAEFNFKFSLPTTPPNFSKIKNIQPSLQQDTTTIINKNKLTTTNNLKNNESEIDCKSLSKHDQKRSWCFEGRERGYNRDLFIKDATDDDENGHDSTWSEQYEEERMASLEALRYALHHAPFCRNMHTLMTIPNEECFEMIGIPTKCAIRVEQLHFKNILDNVTMEIPKGKIYALLGSENNGKSLLLKCILGRKRPTTGNIEVFKQNPTSPLSAICIGYMPQDNSLHSELTIEQTLKYYGQLYQIPPYLIEERIRLLDSEVFEGIEVSKKCDSKTFVKDLGKEHLWRLSLIVTLIHSPPLLLLDEPTDNVDPLLRSKVWSYLEKLCDKDGITILFTTKHPEELCFAYKVGLIRYGHVYMEDRPEELLRNFHCSTYIQMYDKFCMSNRIRRIRSSFTRSSLMTITRVPSQLSCNISSRFGSETLTEKDNYCSNINSDSDLTTTSIYLPLSNSPMANKNENINNKRKSQGQYDSKTTPDSYSDGSIDLQDRLPLPMAEWPIPKRRRTEFISQTFNFKRLNSLILKNFAIIRGHLLPIAMFYFVFPMLQITMFLFIFGRSNLHDIPVMIQIPENDPNNRISKLIQFAIDQKVFQQQMIKNFSLDQIYLGQSWAAIVPWSLEEMMNKSSQKYMINNNNDDCQKWLIHAQSIHSPMFGLRLYMDYSNYFLSHMILLTLIESMNNLLSNDYQLRQLFPEHCSELYLSMKKQLPIDIEEVLYGSLNFRYPEYLLPGCFISIIYVHAVILTAYLFFKEQIAGQQERCLTAGVSGIEIIISHLISQTVLFIMQEIILVLIMFKMIGFPSRSMLIWILIFMQGLKGIATGLFISVVCPRPLMASLITSAIFIPGFFLSGICSPVESIPKPMAYLSIASPLTLPINSLRHIILHGPYIQYAKIIVGYIVSAVYIAILILLSLMIFKIKTLS